MMTVKHLAVALLMMAVIGLALPSVAFAGDNEADEPAYRKYGDWASLAGGRGNEVAISAGEAKYVRAPTNSVQGSRLTESDIRLLSQLDFIQHLRLYDTNLTEASAGQIGKMKLRSLSLSSCRLESIDALQPMLTSVDLVAFKIVGEVVDDGVKDVEGGAREAEPKITLPAGVRSIEFVGASRVLAACAKSIRASDSLERLAIELCVAEKAVAPLLMASSVKALRLNVAPWVDDEYLRLVGLVCTGLVKFEMYGRNSLSKDGLAPIGKCRSLQAMQLDGLNASEQTWLGLAKLERIVVFHAVDCDVPSHVMGTLITSWSLVDLDVSGTDFGDSVIHRTAGAWASLKRFACVNCLKVTDEGIRVLAREFKPDYVNVSGTGVSHRGVEALSWLFPDAIVHCFEAD
jgi:hypothetical protein